eukprot:Protomagalhaensia_sp_Gyna_25__15@NODE_1007_length_2302_cov_307_876270_g775_i1_p3_GENE_NODE_1007_length_2302_cov_307_876270_g775_i1NODE_1007_length_2302_cov_307_876270_g775_i1_p3_ORF_typecomplete_len120_score5_64_NODE_1007_length_2302_cov_307_876270_g775_i18861245
MTHSFLETLVNDSSMQRNVYRVNALEPGALMKDVIIKTLNQAMEDSPSAQVVAGTLSLTKRLLLRGPCRPTAHTRRVSYWVVQAPASRTSGPSPKWQMCSPCFCVGWSQDVGDGISRPD